MGAETVRGVKILLLGKDGQVGWELQRALAPLGEIAALGHQDGNLEDLEGLRKTIRSLSPQVIVNAAAYTAVDKAENEPEKAYSINAAAVGMLAQEACRLDAWLVHYSSDYVFDGEKDAPYLEEDNKRPLSLYGQTKLAGEQFIAESDCSHLIFRTSWVFAMRGRNFLKAILSMAKKKEALEVVADQYGAPTSAELIADVTALALYRVLGRQNSGIDYSGIYHLAADGKTTWHAYACHVLEQAWANGVSLKAKADAVLPVASESYPALARRPRNSLLDTGKLKRTFGIQAPDWRWHVQRTIREISEQGNI
jgi:dTDP-4-dehydrorhamnose reductase